MQCTQELQVVVVARCRVFVGHFWDNGNGGGSLHVTTVQEDADKGLAFIYFIFPFRVFQVAGT